MKLASFSMLIVTSSLCGYTFANDNHQSDEQDIKNVIETFRVSIINKDKESFKNLFYSESTP